ncbi:MAG: hypothetical protein NTX16_13445 [Actinobacteria bacterium]|nr:hypothetical protein [Actinomycetota bacterium]
MRSRRRGIALAVLAAAVLGAALLTACGAKDIEGPTGNIDKAKDVAAKGEILMVKTGIAAYVVTNTAAPPAATQDVLAGFVDPWPTNPWTQAPMVPGKQPGDIVYAPGAGTDYTLGVVLADGSVYNSP